MRIYYCDLNKLKLQRPNKVGGLEGTTYPY